MFHVFQTAFQLDERDVFQRFGAADAVLSADFVQLGFGNLMACRIIDAVVSGLAPLFADDVHVLRVGDFKQQDVVMLSDSGSV